jgi:hypothetical protein
MDPSIRPVEPGPSAPAPLRRRPGEGKPFDLERELTRPDEEEPPDEEQAARREREPTPVAPPDSDEAGGRIDLTA